MVSIADFLAGILADFAGILAGGWEQSVETAPEGAARRKTCLRRLE